HPLAVPVAMMAALVLIYHRYYDLASLIFVAWGLIDYGIRWPERRSLLWKLNISLLVMASYFGSSNLPFRLLDPYLNRFGMTTLFYLNCYFTLFLFLGLLGLFCVDRYTYRNKNTGGDFLNTEFPVAAHVTSNPKRFSC
ncbi:hypothetical protein, partial [Deinococcus sp.]|uniref:hypothetical protein n=1 Tax=Deinococcus sp. TaxID=47478 RepID=UPI0025FF09B6